MEERKKEQNNNSNIPMNVANIDDPNYSKGKDFINRVSTLNKRPTRTSTVYELEVAPKNSQEVLKFITPNKDSLGLHSISIVKEDSVGEEDEKNKNNFKENDDKKEDENEKNKNFKILIETYGENAGEFEKKFNEWKQKNDLNNLELKKVQELYGIDLDSNEKNTKVPLTPEDEKLIERIHAKKWHLLRTLTHNQQCEFIDKLIKLADEKCKKQREALLERHSLPEYRYWLNLIFNSGHLTFQALVKLADVVSERQITENNFTSVQEICSSFWKNPFADLANRDISGKRDRLRVMITPEGQAAMVACHVKLFNYLRTDKKDIDLAQAYDVAIQTLKDEYSKNNREFWSSFLLYVVGLSFLITLAGAIVTALVGLSGFAALAPCAVLLVETLLRTGSKFHTDYGIFPWDWIYWWKDAKANCLKALQSDYMKDVLIKGQTSKLDEEIRQQEIKIALKEKKEALKEKKEALKEKKEALKEKKEDAKLDKISTSKSDKKAMKSKRKLCRFLFWLSMIVLAVSVMIVFFPSVVATAIPLVLSVFKLDVAFTIAPLVSEICRYIAVAATAAAVIFRVMQSNYDDKRQQCKFDTYQTYISPDNSKFFMKFGKEAKFYTKAELEAAGINVEVDDKNEIN